MMENYSILKYIMTLDYASSCVDQVHGKSSKNVHCLYELYDTCLQFFSQCFRSPPPVLKRRRLAATIEIMLSLRPGLLISSIMG